MRNLFRFIAIVALMLSFTKVTYSQVTATATASATIVTPLAITKTADMNFGNLAVNTNPGTVVLTAAASPTRTPTGGVTLMGGGTISAATFNISGLTGANYSVTLPASPHTISSGGNNMTVDDFTSSSTNGYTLTGGSDILYVGATLYVNGSQAAGTYTSGTPFVVTINYN